MKKLFEVIFYILMIIVAVVTIFIWWFLGILCEKPRK